MFFLIEYDRSSGTLVTFRSFPAPQLHEAEEARLTLELELNSAAIEREVVLLDAQDEAALHVTHRRYFETSETLARSLSERLRGSEVVPR